jgi:hypothetical protein
LAQSGCPNVLFGHLPPIAAPNQLNPPTKCLHPDARRGGSTKCKRLRVGEARSSHFVGHTSSHTSSATLRRTLRRLHFVPHLVAHFVPHFVAHLVATLRRIHFVELPRRASGCKHFVGSRSPILYLCLYPFGCSNAHGASSISAFLQASHSRSTPLGDPNIAGFRLYPGSNFRHTLARSDIDSVIPI